MKRLASIVVVGLVTLTAACNKPSEDDCRKALVNMRKLMGTGNSNEDLMPAIRSCRGGSTRESVQCAIDAKTRDDLAACKFAHFDEQSGSGSGSGSGSSAGSGSGSAK